ncbi:peptidyl-prolyl cis-trans isomerase [Desulfovibrio sp. OttesenSCG-928-A18]|nr:peptidyl-prolyl cis-trans isomerase [Desulfovibrio sp. OttesenSCG-928-A18]
MNFSRLFAVLLLCILCCPESQAATTVNRIAAVVNGEMITLHELRMYTDAELARRRIPKSDARADEVRASVLDSLINDILMRQEAKRFKVQIAEDEVEREYSNAITRSGMAKDKFEADLKKRGMTPELARRQIANTMLRQRFGHFMVSRKVFVTPDAVTEYYETHKKDMAKPKTVDFSILVLPPKANVQQLYQQLQSGSAKFEDVAREHSVDSTARDGGRVKDVIWDKLPNEMRRLLSTLKPGKMTPILRTPDGFAIIKLDAISEPRTLSFEEAKPRIEEILMAPMLEERFNELIEQLRSKAVIDIRI